METPRRLANPWCVLPALLLLFLLGIVSGARTFTGPAVLWMMRHPGPQAYVLSGAALFEYLFDLHPQAPPRTSMPSIVARLGSGAFVGWWGAVASGVPGLYGAIAGAAGALAGAYVTLALRIRAIAAIGSVAAGLLEDAVMLAAAVAIVARL